MIAHIFLLFEQSSSFSLFFIIACILSDYKLYFPIKKAPFIGAFFISLWDLVRISALPAGCPA